MSRISTLLKLLPLFATLGACAANCSLDSRCPQDSPCCSQYGQCGVGAYCLGGCDPRMSFSLDACTPEPVCVTKTYAMNSMDGIVDVSKYLGDPTTADWVAQGTPAAYNGNILLTMKPNTAGTVLASTVYMWYGNVKAKIKTSRGAGVVTAFILMSDVHDEIDYEWVGTELDIAQTNYYFQGIPDYTHSGNITNVSDTFENFHEYEIQWTPDTITWLVDGVVGRTQKKSDTWNETAKQWNFPQTPSRVQLSLWPGGASSNAEGTIDWAGGPIDWDNEDIQKYGYDFATIGEVTIECYNATSPPGTNTGKSYTYDSYLALNNTVIDGTNSTILSSFLATGLNMTAGASTSASSTAETVPGLSGGGSGQQVGDTGNSGNSGTGTAASSTCTQTGFSQNGCSSGSSSSSGSGKSSEGSRIEEHVLGASTFAAILALAATIWL